MDLNDALKDRIESTINKDRVVLFMKGSRHFPQCGFSATVIQILDKLLPAYATVNVLADAEIREGVKAYAKWPTIPQLYVDGKFVGGCDIIRDMYVAGELQELLGVEEKVKLPTITVTAAAREAILEAQKDAPGEQLRIEISQRFEYALSLAPIEKGDLEVDGGGITLLIDRSSAERANGMSIDFADGAEAGFKIDNPNEPAQVKQLGPKELKQMMDRGETFQLLDVRTDDERATAMIKGSKLLDQAAQEQLAKLPKDTKLVFHCHSGGRSQRAAEHFITQGFKHVFNLAGGIDAWSQQVDPSVKRY
jgi:monothiol glutaredoxin